MGRKRRRSIGFARISQTDRIGHDGVSQPRRVSPPKRRGRVRCGGIRHGPVAAFAGKDLHSRVTPTERWNGAFFGCGEYNGERLESSSCHVSADSSGAKLPSRLSPRIFVICNSGDLNLFRISDLFNLFGERQNHSNPKRKRGSASIIEFLANASGYCW